MGTRRIPGAFPFMLFGSLEDLARVALVAVCAYAGLVVLLRVAGKRSLAKLNAFDFVVTVAFGSILATMLLSKEVPLTDGLLALVMLAALQYGVSFTSVHWSPFKRLVRSQPRLLLRHGRYLHDELARERVTKGEIDAEIRKHGIGRTEEATAVVLETDGSFSVIRADGEGPLSALHSVAGASDEAKPEVRRRGAPARKDGTS